MATLVLAVLVAAFAGVVFYLADGAKDITVTETKASCTEEDYELSDKIAKSL